jgi:HD-GYP domain-containing protein (c-di-GMP phosphodiesterase class II)
VSPSAPRAAEIAVVDTGPATQGVVEAGAPPEIDTKFHSDYCQISIDDFISGQKIDLNLYVKLNDEKFLLIARAGEPLPPERLVAYREKKLQHLYVSRSDYEVYLSLQLRLLKAIEATKALDADKRLQVLKHANETILQRVYLPGVDPGAFTQAKAFTEATVALTASHGDVSGLLDALNATSEHLYAHSVGVTLYSLIVAKKLGWTSPGALLKLGLGALLHDVGLKNAPPVLLTKARRHFNRDEQQAWERHTLDGVELLKGIDGIPVETLYVVSQHHEDRTGTGYPSGLKEASIFPLARMVHAVDEFCDLVLKWPGVTPMRPLAAVDMLLNLKGAQLDPITLRALRAVFVISDEKKTAAAAAAQAAEAKAAVKAVPGKSALEGLAKKGAA